MAEGRKLFQVIEFGAEFFVEAAGLSEAMEFFELEAKVEIHVAPIVGEVRGNLVFWVIRGQGAAVHGVEEKGLVRSVAGGPEGAVLGEDEFAHVEGGGDEVLVDQFRRVEFPELIEFAQDAGAFLEEDEQDFLNGEEEDFWVGAFWTTYVIDVAVDVIDAVVAQRAIPIIRGIEKFQHAGHHPAGTPLGHRLAVEVKGVGVIGFGIIGVHGWFWS